MTREEAIKHLEDMKKGLFLWDMTELIDLCISALSENKGENRPKGEWLETFYDYECSNCHIIRAKGRTGIYNFCPNCGTDMRGE